MQELQDDIRNLIVEALMLEDVRPEEIEIDSPLFVEGLGLDSIDALELSMAIHKRYGVRIKADDERNQAIFRNVRSLSEYVGAHRSTEPSKAGRSTAAMNAIDS